MIAQEVTKKVNTFDCLRAKRLSGARQSGRRIQLASGLALDLRVRYIDAVASKKGAIGIGVPKQFCDESRNLRTRNAAFSFAPPFLAARWGSFGSTGFRRDCPVRQPVELPPLIGVRDGGFSKPQSLEANHG